MRILIVVLVLFPGLPAFGFGRHFNIQSGELSRNRLPARPNLAHLLGKGETWECVEELARGFLKEAGLVDLALDSYYSSYWALGQGTWYKVRASQTDGKSFDLELRVKHDSSAQTCWLQSDYTSLKPLPGLAGGKRPDFALLKESRGTVVIAAGVVPKTNNWKMFHYYCSGCAE